MRFARQSAIFRGPLDPAAVISVLFLLVLFMMVGSLLYTPGVLVRFAGASAPNAQTITITGDNEILFAGRTNKVSDLEQWRDSDLKNPTNQPPFRLKVESGADPKVVEKVRELFQVQLPASGIANLAGTDNPTVVVAVNFRGQCFFDNRPVGERGLKEELRYRVQEASHVAKDLTMVLEADKATENEVIMRLYHLAQDAGVKEVLLAERPNPLAPSLVRLRP